MNPGLVFGDRNMNLVDMESEDSSDDEDDEDYILDQEEFDEEMNAKEDDTVRNYNMTTMIMKQWGTSALT